MQNIPTLIFQAHSENFKLEKRVVSNLKMVLLQIEKQMRLCSLLWES